MQLQSHFLSLYLCVNRNVEYEQFLDQLESGCLYIFSVFLSLWLWNVSFVLFCFLKKSILTIEILQFENP